ncbi:Protein ANTAGONIST OF LIKE HETEROCHROMATIN PROTEIN 1 [Frankliniella fusca]|uniref:Protein ANTAGONIST OF LIKE HETEROCHROMATIN PROTEIN 1 n=1 Tax=Frankliniella fusca TaxID=407009 RepID=A0AAE1LLN8_9NEOP|nr:Protein ANTAGONIST OF LIKE HETEROCHROMATIN PROTEIN 1 [Frankliniella fusca]
MFIFFSVPENHDWELNEAFLQVAGNPLSELEEIMFPLLQQHLIELDLEDEIILEVFYPQNNRTIDWRAALPRMQYLRGLEDPYFLKHFRMDKAIFQNLTVMGNHLTDKGRLIRLRTEIDKCLLMALWILSTLDTFRSTGIQFGVSRGVVHFHYVLVIEALRELAPKYIKWPSLVERQRISQSIEARTGYLGIIGAIDGTLIKITAPRIQKGRYFDRHQSYSINVQAVCDDNLLFRDVYIGEPGSVHDIRVFERSPLNDMFLERNDLISADEHLVGDCGYELRRKLLMPFRDNGVLTQRQRLFNYVHSSIRMCVERSFGRLKGKFRRLFYLYTKKFVYLIDHILSSFVLHNFVLLEGRESASFNTLTLPTVFDGGTFMQPDRHNHLLLDEDEDEDELGDEDEFEEEENEDDIMDGEQDEEQDRAAGGRAGMLHPLLAQSKIDGYRKREDISQLLVQLVNEDH